MMSYLMKPEPVVQQGPLKVTIDDDRHHGQHRPAVNQPQQQHNQPLNDAVASPNGQPDMADYIPIDVPQLDDLPDMQMQPKLGDEQAGQPPHDKVIRLEGQPDRHEIGRAHV